MIIMKIIMMENATRRFLVSVRSVRLTQLQFVSIISNLINLNTNLELIPPHTPSDHGPTALCSLHPPLINLIRIIISILIWIPIQISIKIDMELKVCFGMKCGILNRVIIIIKGERKENMHYNECNIKHKWLALSRASRSSRSSFYWCSVVVLH